MTEDNPCRDRSLSLKLLLHQLTITTNDVDLDVWQALVDCLSPHLSDEVTDIFWQRIRCGADESAVIGLVEHIFPHRLWFINMVGRAYIETPAVVGEYQAASPALALAAALVSTLIAQETTNVWKG